MFWSKCKGCDLRNNEYSEKKEEFSLPSENVLKLQHEGFCLDKDFRECKDQAQESALLSFLWLFCRQWIPTQYFLIYWSWNHTETVSCNSLGGNSERLPTPPRMSNSSSFDYWNPAPGQARSCSPPYCYLHTGNASITAHLLGARNQDTERLHHLPKGTQ